MLTNFFGKSNPINFIICGVYLLLGLIMAFYLSSDEVRDTVEIFRKLGMFLLLFFSLLLLDFVIRKNSLTQINTYAILIFVCLIAMIPGIFSERLIITSNVFLLLALRRLASLPSERNIEKKLLDASLYISIATLFHFWSILVFVPLLWSITKIQNRSFRMIFIPFAGLFAILILAVTYHLVLHDSLVWFAESWIPKLRFDFSAYHTTRILIPSAIIGTLLVWIVTIRLLKASSIPRKQQRNYKLLTLWVIVCFAVGILSDVISGAELLFLMVPLAIITTNYIEKKEDFWFHEILLWTLMLLPFVLFFSFA